MKVLWSYKTLPLWTSTNIPEALLTGCQHEDGVWASLSVEQGSLIVENLSAIGESLGQQTLRADSDDMMIAPLQKYRIVSFSDDIRCQQTLSCRAEDYFSRKYQLTATHSEVVSASEFITPGKTLDLGCGVGRNALYLNLKGFDVTAWDKNAESIARVNELITLEGLTNISAQVNDLNSLEFSGNYDFILSTVVFMFLNRESIPSLIESMQAATKAGGYNLIVAAMDTTDYPCPLPFSFTFKEGELKSYYQHWDILKYNENAGQLHKTDSKGERIKLQFATLLAKKVD